MQLKDVEFRLVQDRDELEFTYKLICSRYRDKEYLNFWPYDIWVTPHCLHPDTFVMVALIENKIIGTASVFLKGEMGLPLFSLCPNMDIAPRMVEIGKLAVAKEVGENLFGSIAEVGVVMGMFSLLYRCGLWLERNEFLDDFLISIAVVPAHRPFYRRLGFESISEEPSPYPTFKGVRAFCMYQSFHHFKEFVENHLLLKKFFSCREEVNPYERYVLSWEDVMYFSKERTNLWEEMEDKYKEILKKVYSR